jgi:Glycosyltransferase
MKILHVITSLRYGGAERLITTIVPMLQNKGHSVDVCLFDGYDSSFKQSLLAEGVSIICFGNCRNVYNPLNILKLVRLMRHYDIVHSHNTSPQLFAAIGSIFCNSTLITTEHSTYNKRRRLVILKYLDRWMYNRYRSVICISDAVKNSLVNYLGVIKPSLFVISNGIRIIDYKSALPLSSSIIDTKKLVITMVSAFRYQKDQDTLIRAMSRLNKDKFEVWLVGDGERRDDIEKLICELNLSNNVKLFGIRNDIPSIMKSSDIVVQSSHIEGFGLTAVEGMAAGKPVIASDVPGLSQVVSGAGLLFPEGDDEALELLILRLAEDKAFYDRVSSDCSRRADDYDIGLMVNKIDKVYRSTYSRS